MTSVSVILPFCNQADDVREIVTSHAAALAQAGIGHEIILVPNGSTDDTNAVCRALAAEMPGVRCVEIEGRGWGCAVRSGIAAAAGALICYTNSARTQPHDLGQIIDHALRNPGLVVKATRVSRDAWIRRGGSLRRAQLRTLALHRRAPRPRGCTGGAVDRTQGHDCAR